MAGGRYHANDALEARQDERERDDDIVFVALTRPAMFWGTPIESFSMIPPFAFVAMIVGDNPLWALVAAAVCFFGFRALAGWDPHFARRIFLAARTKGRALNIKTWGGPSMSPRVPGFPLEAKDLPVQAVSELDFEEPGLLDRLRAEAESREARFRAR